MKIKIIFLNQLPNAFREKSNLSGMQSPKAVSIGKKRPLEEEDENCEMMEHVETKRPCPLTNNSSSTTSGNLEKILNFPLPSSESVGCITKIYSEEEQK